MGLETGLNRSIGMFAIALVDVQRQILFLARDRLGEKPLYYGWSNNHFFFGSELKAFRPHPGFTPTVDRGSLTLYLRHSYVPSPHCIFEGFRKLLPGTYFAFARRQRVSRQRSNAALLGTSKTARARAFLQPFVEDCVDGLEELFAECNPNAMLADVPVARSSRWHWTHPRSSR